MNSRTSLYAVLALTLGASVWTWWSDSNEPVEAAVQRHSKAQIKPQTQPRAEQMQSVELASSATSNTPAAQALQPQNAPPQDLFSDAASTVVAAPPAPPSAPELPFVYAGKLLQEAQYSVFLSMGERNLVVHQGDIIDQQWRVDSISPPTMQLSYLPMRIKRVMNIGAAN